MEKMSSWDDWVLAALSKLESQHLTRSLRPIHLRNEREPHQHAMPNQPLLQRDLQVFDEMQPWDRSSVEVQISDATFQKWLLDISSPGDEADCGLVLSDSKAGTFKNLLLFSGNDYLGLSSHPTIGKAAAKAALEHGMGPRGSALICGYTNYHRLLESSLADLKKKEDCLLCPTGFAANMAVMVTLGSVGSLLASDVKPLEHERVAIFSDALNHASIIDGIRLAERQRSVELFIYRHCNMNHLNALLSSCTLRKKVVVTDSLFSMDGDFAPMNELVKLREKYGFLLVIDDVSPPKAHGTFVCGKNGGGVAEQFNCEKDVDICVGTLSKAAEHCCKASPSPAVSQQLGLDLLAVTLGHEDKQYGPTWLGITAVIVGRKEMWRRRAIWDRVQDFRALTGIPITSPIISLIIGSEDKALEASQHLLRSGFHVTAIRPPTVPPNSCRLRVTLSATHTRNDLVRLTAALSRCINLKEISVNGATGSYARM
ncbi:hypothetical protein TIFTF001_010246 [Ficus carica]|uniref:Aminotransferase class I/classII large domain-containing protein n=1 Tax=Ficus carica TaxID=3494 RepID=A0AA88A8D3_FICCA|nr:hypothetical protein TIFTF001_010246 [Ficus carica]